MDKYIKYEDIQECRFFQDERGEWILHTDIIKIPAADVVPVVRCKDCKYNGHCFTQSFVRDESIIPFDPDTWFCADGERTDGKA